MSIKSFQKAVATAGTALQVAADNNRRVFLFRAHSGNTGTSVYIGNDGNDDVSSTTGLALGKGDPGIVLECRLNEMWVDVDTSGDKLCILYVIH